MMPCPNSASLSRWSVTNSSSTSAIEALNSTSHISRSPPSSSSSSARLGGGPDQVSRAPLRSRIRIWSNRSSYATYPSMSRRPNPAAANPATVRSGSIHCANTVPSSNGTHSCGSARYTSRPRSASPSSSTTVSSSRPMTYAHGLTT
jgi:hypothetical protein